MLAPRRFWNLALTRAMTPRTSGASTTNRITCITLSAVSCEPHEHQHCDQRGEDVEQIDLDIAGLQSPQPMPGRNDGVHAGRYSDFSNEVVRTDR